MLQKHFWCLLRSIRGEYWRCRCDCSSWLLLESHRWLVAADEIRWVKKTKRKSWNLQLAAYLTVFQLWCSSRQASRRSFVQVPTARPRESRTRRTQNLCASESRDPTTCWWTWWARKEEKLHGWCLPWVQRKCCRRKLWKKSWNWSKKGAKFRWTSNWILKNAIRSYQLD